jgi:REP element-mobilizing transposase RayT
MPQSFSQVYVHITFSTKYRTRSIDDNIKEELWDYLGGTCKALECNPVRVGGYSNHIHICCLLSKKITQMKLLEEIKKSSSKWIKTKGKQYSNFYWQDGYGIFSVSPRYVDRVVAYIENQEEHHKRKEYQQEFLSFLKKYKIEYDERYLWD